MTLPPPSQLQSPLIFPIFFIVLILSLLPPPSPLRRYASIAAITTCAVIFHSRPVSADPSASYAASLFWVLYARILIIHLRHPVPESVLYRPAHNETAGSALTFSTPRKLVWILHLFSTPRHLGWSTPQLRHLPPPPPRREFILRKLRSLPAHYLLLDALHTHHVLYPTHSLWTLPLPSQLFWTLKGALTARYTMEFQYDLVSLLCVGSGLSDAGSWPPLFGSWSEAYTIRRLWTRTWHQMLRYLFVEIADFLRTPRAATAFVASGIAHALAMYTVSGGREGLWIGSLQFFVVWMFGGIVVESAVAKWWGDRRPVYWIGYLWTAAVLVVGGRYMAEEMIRVGMDENPVPGSVVRPALKAWDGR